MSPRQIIYPLYEFMPETKIFLEARGGPPRPGGVGDRYFWIRPIQKQHFWAKWTLLSIRASILNPGVVQNRAKRGPPKKHIVWRTVYDIGRKNMVFFDMFPKRSWT